MRILLIDDSELHRRSALQSLVGHDLTIVSTYDEAHALLEKPYVEDEPVREAMNARHSGLSDVAWRNTYEAIAWEMRPEARFDVVLSDLLMPASKMTMGEEGLKFVGQEMPVGFALALMASQVRVRYAAVVTDTNHHDHPSSAWLDAFAARTPHAHDLSGAPPKMTVNGMRLGFYHAPLRPVDGTTCSECGGTGGPEMSCYCIKHSGGSVNPDCDGCGGSGRRCWPCQSTGKQYGKDWGKVLEHLLASPAPVEGESPKS